MKWRSLLRTPHPYLLAAFLFPVPRDVLQGHYAWATFSALVALYESCWPTYEWTPIAKIVCATAVLGLLAHLCLRFTS